MRTLSYMLLSLLLLIGNTAIAADLHAEALSGQHHPEYTSDNPSPHTGTHAACHHCCHGHAHFLSVPTDSRFNGITTTAHDWVIISTIRPEYPGHAPPTPPPIIPG